MSEFRRISWISDAAHGPSPDAIGSEPVPPSGAVPDHPGASPAPDTKPLRNHPPSDCPNCIALRGTSRLLADAALYLIDRNAELTRQLEAYRERDRRHADALLGLAGLAKAEAGR